MNKTLQIAGKVWTGREPVRSLVIETRDDRITRVIPREQAVLRADAIQLPEIALLIPGLHDAHAHLLYGGLALGWCDASDARSSEEFLAALEHHVRTRDDDPTAWAQGKGLDEVRAAVTRYDLDRVCCDVPVFIWCRDLHSAVANTLALQKAGINENAADPPNGKFERDAANRLTGMLRESAAKLVENAIPEPTAEQARFALRRAQKHAFSLGITAVSSSTRAARLPHYLRFAESSEQKIRINSWCTTEHFNVAADRFDRIENRKFRLATFKGFIDGTLGSHTATFWKSYSDNDTTGMTLMREGPLARFIRDAHHAGYHAAFHAIGDRAVSLCLDAFEMAGSTGRGPEYRPRIEHAQHIREQDLPRFAELGVVVSMQPVHCREDMHLVEARLGTERAKFSLAWQSLLKHGATLCFGSDWPVVGFDPVAGIHAAVTRQDAKGNPTGGWQPQEKLTMEETLRAFTLGSAYAAFWENDLGMIEEGKLADFTVFSRDFFACKPEEILQTNALMTVVGGEVVYRRDEG
jgi:predicted amidohydrolase YtcJ